MKARLDETADAAGQVESFRLELERCQRDLDACRRRRVELEQAELLLAGEKRILEMIGKGNPLPAILDALCRLVEEMSAGTLCSNLLLDPNNHRLWNGATPSLPAGYSKAIDGSAIGPGTEPCGRAAWLKEPVIVSDITTYPLKKFRDLASGRDQCNGSRGHRFRRPVRRRGHGGPVHGSFAGCGQIALAGWGASPIKGLKTRGRLRNGWCM